MMEEQDDDIDGGPIDGGLTRLWVAGDLAAGAAAEIGADQTHYLRNVMRLKPGAEILVFNGRDGEWLVRVEALGKNSGRITPLRQTRVQPAAASDCWLVFAPVKRTRIDILIEKATELGASALLPVWTDRTNVSRLNLDRLRAHAREAAEQSERLTLPELHEPQALDRLLRSWPEDRRLLLCDETGAPPPIADSLLRSEACVGGWAILIGPEGGWSPAELDRIGKLPNVARVGLGPRVLRADTAAVAALAVLQALKGDWSGSRAGDQSHLARWE